MLSRAQPVLRRFARNASSLKDTVFAMVPAKQKELKDGDTSYCDTPHLH
jgi:hypothetical protein